MADHPDGHFHISRRSMLIGGGAGVGLVLAWGVWPRTYKPNIVASPGETIFNGFLKIGTDGHVAVVVAQAEMGQGVTTALPQILADELGADWRTISVDAAPLSPLYANDLIMAETAHELPSWLQDAGEWTLRQMAIRSSLMFTGGSTSIRGFEQRYREAGAAARTLLCMAAASRWEADWQACETQAGFVVRGKDRLRFGDLAAEAANFTPPNDIAMRMPGEGGVVGKSVPRIDLPSKVDGSARFAGDVRLPGMVFASVRHAPFGAATLVPVDRKKAEKIIGIVGIVENPRWVATVGTTWWAAETALEAMAPRFTADDGAPDDVSIRAALEAAMKDGKSALFVDQGDSASQLAGKDVIEAEYRVPLAVHAPMETLVATARATGDRMEIWMPTQAPGLARAAVARAIGVEEGAVTIYPMLVGGGFGRKLSNDAAVQAAIIASKLERPVQMVWSRSEEIGHDAYRPPAIGLMRARLGERGVPVAWAARIATPPPSQPSPLATGPDDPSARSIEGALPAYVIAAIAIEHRVARIGVPTGVWRSDAHSYTAFFTECFIDELARKASLEPFSYRMQMLNHAPRLARCLATVTTLGEWQGGEVGSGQGIAAHSCFGSHVAMLAEVRVGDGGKIIVDRIVAVVDCGRMIHPDIVRQQIEGGILWGLAAALGNPISLRKGRVTATGFGDLGLPMLTDTPEIVVELIENKEAPGGVSEIAVPPVAPAIANAVFAATGKRLRTLPLRIANA